MMSIRLVQEQMLMNRARGGQATTHLQLPLQPDAFSLFTPPLPHRTAQICNTTFEHARG